LPTPPEFLLVVPDDADGALLGDVLAAALPAERPATLRAAIAAGEVRVGGSECLTNRRVRAGDVVQWRRSAPPARPAAAVRPLPPVLWESASALVVGKAAGVPTVPDRAGVDLGVHGQLPALRPHADLRIVHRLDRDTSGCLLLGKGLAAAQHFDRQFAEALVQKTYVAVVQGHVARDEFAIDAWLGPDRRRPGKVVASPKELPGFRAAHTDVVVRQRFAQHTLLALQPRTGRSHQLRVHLQSIGHPIAGDRDYGGEELLLSRLKPGYKLRKGVPERPLLARMFLHAERLSFLDVDGAAVAVECPLPEDLAVALRQLASHDERRR
jgi:23S rRNA pseudouridine955/2504/2580 synthase/23S rRNA pseudouridine1911/1915/1917 synthase